MTQRFTTCLLIALLPLTSALAAEVFSAELFTLDGKEKKMSYEGKRELTVNSMNFEATYKNLDGSIAVEEKASATEGTLVRYDIDRKQTNEKGTIEIADKKVIFKYFDGNKQKADKKEPLSPDTLVGPTLFPFLLANYDKLAKKEDVKFKYAVWYRQETVGFKFSFEKEDGKFMVVRMAPTNMLYRSLVDPIFISIDKTSRKVMVWEGRTTPKINVDGKFKDFDTVAKYTYHEPAAPVALPEEKTKAAKPAKKK